MRIASARALLFAAAAGALVLAAAGFAWRNREGRRIAAVVPGAVPAVPDLTGWPAEYAARLRTATGEARRLQQPLAALEEIARLDHANSLYREAKQAETGLAALEPRNPRWTCYLADTCQNLGDQEGARAYLEQTIALDPGHSPSQLKLGDLYFKLGQPADARIQYFVRLRLVPDDPYARLGLARIAIQSGDLKAARGYLEAIVRDNPDFYSAHNLLAEVFDQQGDSAAAAKERDAVQGRFYEADDPWLKQLYGWSFDPFRLIETGVAAFQAEQFRSSLSFYERAVRDAPADVSGYEALAGLYLRLNRPADADATRRAGRMALARGTAGESGGAATANPHP